MKEVAIGVDIGTGSVKAVATDPAGKVLGEVASAALTTLTPAPGASEQNPEQLLAAVGDAITRVARLAPNCRVAGIAAAAQSGSVVPIARGGAPARVITWMDARSVPVIDKWSAADRTMIRQRSGWGTSPGLGLSTLAWMRDSDPSAFNATERFASVDDFVVHHLTGEFSTNPSNAAGMQLMDVANSRWSQQLCDFAGVTTKQLSTIVTTGSNIAPISDRAGDAWNVGRGASIIAGGHDQACAALALGVVEPGTVFLSAGTAWVLTTPAAHCDIDSLPAGINLSPHLTNDRWSASRHIGGLGAAIAWAIGELGITTDDLTTLLQAHSPSRSDPFFIPTLAHPARVAWGRYAGRPDDSTPAVLAWAVLESTAFEVRRELDLLSSLFANVATLVVVGRAATPLVCRLIASACGIRIIRREETSWPALGAAQIAASALGWAPPESDPTRSEIFDPYPPLTDTLAARYHEYRTIVEGD